MDVIFSSPKTILPSKARGTEILFLLNLCEARLWKYAIFLSPETIQWVWLHCCHSFSSNQTKSFTLFFCCRKKKKNSTLSPWTTAASALCKDFFFSTKFLVILHTEGTVLHASFTVVWQPSFSSLHYLWSEELQTKVRTFVAGKKKKIKPASYAHNSV